MNAYAAFACFVILLFTGNWFAALCLWAGWWMRGVH